MSGEVGAASMMVLRVALCRDAVASGMTSRQQASLEATTIKTVSDGVKRQ